MAYKMRVPVDWINANPNAAKVPYLLNLDATVGPNAPNRTDDVMLVQYLLRRSITAVIQTKSYNKGDRPTQVSLRDEMGDWFHAAQLLPSNGAFDIITAAVIVVYQMRLYGVAGIPAIDGKVEPIPNVKVPSRSTLLRLNSDVITGRAGHPELMSDPGLPGPLKLALRDFRK